MSPFPVLCHLSPTLNELAPGLIEALVTHLFREEPADPFVPRTTHLYESLLTFFNFKKRFIFILCVCVSTCTLVSYHVRVW